MAVAATYHYAHGAVSVCDDAYRDLSPEERKRREEHMWRAAYEIALGAQTKRKKTENKNRSWKCILPRQNPLNCGCSFCSVFSLFTLHVVCYNENLHQIA